MTAGDPILLPESPAGAPVEGLREALRQYGEAYRKWWRADPYAPSYERYETEENDARSRIESLFKVLRDERDVARDSASEYEAERNEASQGNSSPPLPAIRDKPNSADARRGTDAQNLRNQR